MGWETIIEIQISVCSPCVSDLSVDQITVQTIFLDVMPLGPTGNCVGGRE